jgi:geranylgeranyl diphosphate synthase type I
VAHLSGSPRLKELGANVEQRIEALLAVEQDRWAALDPALVDPLEALRRFVQAGGKRLRPAFCFWGFAAAGGDPADPRVIDVGAAYELLHAFALMHDDVMDGSDIRRGRPTTHVESASRHSSAGWRGEARRFGEGVAILVGDLAQVYADLLVDEAMNPRGGPEIAPAGRAEVVAVWHDLRRELILGQYLDVLGTARGDRDRATARRISRYKSARYTVERPLALGCALAGGTASVSGELSVYGRPVGEAFQLRDDVLGAFGDAAETGKPVGQDLREGKPTPLLAAAFERATGNQAAVLDRVGRGDLGEAEVASIQEVLRATGALAEIERRVADLTSEAVAAIEQASIEPIARQPLIDLAFYVARRSA